MASKTIWKLYYWNFVGRGEFIRLIFEEAGVKYEDIDDAETLVKMFKQEQLSLTGCWPVKAPPMIERTDTGFTLGQTPAICKYLGDEFGLSPTPGSENSYRAEQINAQIHDFIAEGRLSFHGRNPIESYHTQKEETKPYIECFVNERLEQHMRFFEKVLTKNISDSGFVIGHKLTYVDLGLFHVLQATEFQFPEAWNNMKPKFSKLTNFMEKIASRENIAKYIKSDRRRKFCGDSMM